MTQKKEFQALSDHVQNLVGQIAAGNTSLESRVQAEHSETRALLVKEVKDTGGQVTSDIATASQRTRFLDSLKSDRMNQRYNDITDPEEATYQRIFAAYDRACNDMSEPDRDGIELLPNGRYLASIDKGLDQLASWLQNSDSLFWISGKPGSGKSTFMKTIVNSSSVKMLLERWKPRVEMISHFFWKIGSKPQNSVKGLLCTLSYQILLRHKDLLISIPNFQDLVLSKSSYHDWSLGEAKSLLLHLLNSSDKSFCIFVDGLDEVNDEEGSEAILSIVSKMAEQQHVKVCVSSRPEHQLQLGFASLRAPNIKMEWFTACDMQLYAEKELEPLKSSGLFQDTDFIQIVSMLIRKADGVFLWLCLAIRSVKDGAKNRDSPSELFSRLEQLPGQLEDLYTDMWSRLNHNMSVYRDMAASIFLCVIEAPATPSISYDDGSVLVSGLLPTVVATGFAVDRDFAREFAQSATDPVALDPLPLCKRMEKMIKIRSAGLLEVGKIKVPSGKDVKGDWDSENVRWTAKFVKQVRFIHRTAYDFFVSTETGKAILKHSKSTSVDLQIKVLESYLCLAQLLSTRRRCFVHGISLMSEIRQAVKRYDPDSTEKAQYEQHISTIMARIEKAHSYGYVKNNYMTGNWYPSLLGLTAQWETFDGFTVSHARKIASSTTVEDIWRGVWSRNFPPTEDGLISSMRLINETLPFSSNWHHDYSYTLNVYELRAPIIWRHTPFTRLLVEGLSLITWIDAVSKFGKKSISETSQFNFLDLLLNAASTVTNWDSHMIIVSQFFPEKGTFLAIPHLSNLDIYCALCQATQGNPIPKRPDLGWVFYHQMPLRLMFQKVVANLKSRVSILPALTDQLDEILQTCQDSSPRAQILIRLEGHRTTTCYQTVSQAPFEAFNSILFTSSSHQGQVSLQLEEEISSLTGDPTATKVTSLQVAFTYLAQLGYGLCINADAELEPQVFRRELLFSMERRLLDI